MGLHEKAWSGLNIVVFGASPMLPMTIEQTISKASPSNECRIDSFENYEQAYDFIKNQRNVGMIFLTDNCGQLDPSNVLREFANVYETCGMPCFGVLFYEKDKTFVGYRALEKNKNFLGYYSIENVTKLQNVYSFLELIWTRFVDEFEARVIPSVLKDTYLTLAMSDFSKDSYIFRERLSNLLSPGFNISWLERVAIRWAVVLKAIEKKHPNVVSANSTLKEICLGVKTEIVATSIDEIIKSNSNLPTRFNALLTLLDEHRKSHKLDILLGSIAKLNQPGAPAIVRHVAKNISSIQKISHETKSSIELPRAS